jgi:murein DD-endopeptidase MepM/ murein hydrolase activator NlpD
MVNIKRLLILSALTLSACGHLQTGEYKSGADYDAPNTNESPATAAAPAPGERSPADIAHEYQIGFHWPVSQVHITQSFAPAKNPRHKGIDIGGFKGMPIMASKEGRVIYTGHAFRGYGNMVLIEHEGKMATLYAHLNRIKVRQGQNVKVGQTVGLMGRTGRATGVHLHFEVMYNRQPMDPLLFLNETQFISYK